MMERRLSISRKSAATQKSPNFCAAMELRKRVWEMLMRILVAALVTFVFSASPLLSERLFSQEKGGTMSLQISSTAFSAGEAIPKKFTCDGPDVSPQLKWNDPSANTQTFALIMDDPDAPAGTWVHWVLYDLPANTRELPEGVAKQDQLSSAERQGRNDFGKTGYNRPGPPPANPARCFCKLHALDTNLNLK